MSAIDEYIEHMAKHAPGHATLMRAAIDDIASLRAAVAERDKWRAWKPDDEDLSALQSQAKSYDGTYTASLAACAVYIGALEARLRERDAAIARARDEGSEWMRQCVMHMLHEKSREFFKEYERQNGDTSSADLQASNCVAGMRDLVSFLQIGRAHV